MVIFYEINQTSVLNKIKREACPFIAFFFAQNLINSIIQEHQKGILFGPSREKTCLRGLRQSEIQTSLLSYRDYLET